MRWTGKIVGVPLYTLFLSRSSSMNITWHLPLIWHRKRISQQQDRLYRPSPRKISVVARTLRLNDDCSLFESGHSVEVEVLCIFTVGVDVDCECFTVRIQL